MTNVDKMDEDLRALLEGIRDDDPVDVLVHPASTASDLEPYLSGHQAEGLRYNVLRLHGSIAVRAPKRLINEIARRADVALITAMPSATIDPVGGR